MTTTTPWSDTPPSVSKAFLDAAEIEANTQIGIGPRVLDAEETVALTAEVERLRAELATLRELRVFDWKLKERLEKRLSKYEDVRYVTAQGQGEEVSVPAEELDQLRAAAAELAEIKLAWRMAAKDL